MNSDPEVSDLVCSFWVYSKKLALSQPDILMQWTTINGLIEPISNCIQINPPYSCIANKFIKPTKQAWSLCEECLQCNLGNQWMISCRSCWHHFWLSIFDDLYLLLSYFEGLWFASGLFLSLSTWIGHMIHPVPLSVPTHH